VEHAENSGYRMLNMLNLSLDLYKMETGAYKLQPKPVDLAPIVRRIFSELASDMKPRNVTAELSVHGEQDHENAIFTASGEEVLLYSMLSNLIRNAVEASPKDGLVRVALASGKDVNVTIHNMGAVPEHIRETFFNKYVTSGKREGTGLGAYGAKLIAVTHGGGVGCESDEEHGTTVTVTLPKDVEGGE
jgi:signal transduction histidine kinase